MLLKILALIKGKIQLILLLTCSVASAAIATYVTNFVWDSKYTKLELTMERDKSNRIAELQAKQVAVYEKIIHDYNESVDRIATIVEVRNVEVEESAQKYRNLYAAYSKLQNNAPSAANCYIGPDRSVLLMQSVQQANEARTRYISSAKPKGSTDSS